jgi:hypothetical protein
MTKALKKMQIDAKILFKLVWMRFLIILLVADTSWSKWRIHLFPIPELVNRLRYLNQTQNSCWEWGVWGPRHLLPTRGCP